MTNTFGIAEFKTAFGCDKIDIVRNPKTNKLFGACSNGKSIKVEQAIDFTKAVVVLVEDGNMDDACIINERASNVQITL